jgi:uncharacterized membrane protein
MKAQTLQPRKTFPWRKVGWSVMTFLAALVFLMAGRYLTLNPDTYFSEQKAVYLAHTTALLMHIVGAMLAVILGPFQFLPKSRSRRFLNVHRWLGRTYLIGVLVGGLGGLYMARLSYGGLPTHLGFASLGILWLFSGWQAYRHIRRREIEPHREWMIRNYALTFAGVMLRLWMPILVSLGVEFLAAYTVVAWLCWIPNLLVVEWMIRRRRAGRQQAVTSKLQRSSSLSEG